MRAPTIQVIVVNYRTPELTLKATAAALREMEGLDGRITVVDNGSGDDSVALIAEAIARNGWDADGRVVLMPNAQNGGFGAGNNAAIRDGLGAGRAPDFHYLLNSDAWPEPGAIRALLRVMQENRDCGFAGSCIRGVDGAPHQTAFRFPSIAGEFEGAARTGIVTRLLKGSVVPLPAPQTLSCVDWVAGASVLIRRRTLNEIGLFDERFFLYFEETDLSYRGARAGWKTYYEPRSEVVHVGSVSTGMKTWARTPGYWFGSRLHYFTKAHGRAYAAAATLARIAGGLIWRLRCALSRRPVGEPPHFLRDLIAHGLRRAFRRAPHARTLRGTTMKDVNQ
ncbi:glycosyltransferase family 2 protein [Roseovarius spongiae]|uniref:Glycosyltransferase family 2 protein n=1 Tax=Roseovarius spongiae TaxID=2320272 RepID=A0A3A8AWZ7_9RHOB|nr:glycosyltransferase family 2 protein [Roseovarius spongiae]RKF16923.1 glycosyltransferase family 2 protein [Roseovarius spongiae]